MEREASLSPAEVMPLNGADYLRKLPGLLDSAKSTIDVMMYEWKWHPHEGASPFQQMSLKFCAAARRGVKVRVLLNAEKAGYYLTTLNAQTIETLKKAGCDAKLSPHHPTVHAKMIIIDREFVVVGSHNFSKKSLMVNDESSALIKSREVANKFWEFFDLRWRSY